MTVATRANKPEVVFRAVEYGEAHAELLAANRELAHAELPGHPDLEPPEGPELEPVNRGIFLVAYVNRQPAASGGYRTWPDDPSGNTAEIVRMYVRPGSRGSGIGRALLTELETRAWHDDYERVVMHLGPNQPAAKALYEILGYRVLPGVSPDSWQGGRQTYGKQLTEPR